MKRKDIIKQVIADFHETSLPTLIARETSLSVIPNKIITIIGVRRSGKTFYLFEQIQKLLKEGVKKQNIIYINFEDERLNLKIEELDLILQAYRELYPHIHLADSWFFFDEIQNIEGWDKFIRRIFDQVSKKIFITGSNANLLSKEIATSLRGRTLPFEVFTLSFSEYLTFKNIVPRQHSSQGKAKILKAFKEYMLRGGFPETVWTEHSDATHPMGNYAYEQTIREYFNVMLYRDLIERYQFTGIQTVKYFLLRIINQAVRPLSVNKIFNELKSQGVKVSKNSLYEYLQAADAVYMIQQIKKYDPSLIKREGSERKIYSIDNSLLNTLSGNFSDDYGRLLENLVFLYLRKHFRELYYHKKNKECDFILCDREKPVKALQVCYDLSRPETRQKELSGLEEACTLLKLKEGYIITMDEEENIKYNGLIVKIIPAYKVFLNGF